MGTAVDLAAVVVLTILLFTILIWVTARTLNRAERQRKAGETRLAAQYATTHILAEAGSLAEAMPRILQAVGESLDWVMGARWSVDPEANVLRCVEMWIAPPRALDEFVGVNRRVTFSPGVGLPGRVWKSGTAAWIPDVVKDSNFPRARYAAKEGLHGAFGFPIVGPAGFLGVMEFFSPEIREPDEDLLKMFPSPPATGARAASQQPGPHARPHVRRLERLGEVVRHPRLEAHRGILAARQARDEYDGHVAQVGVGVGAQRTRDRDAVGAGHLPVEEDECRSLRAGHAKRRLPVAGRQQPEALRREGEGQEPDDRGIVVGDQDGGGPCGRDSRRDDGGGRPLGTDGVDPSPRQLHDLPLGRRQDVQAAVGRALAAHLQEPIERRVIALWVVMKEGQAFGARGHGVVHRPLGGGVAPVHPSGILLHRVLRVVDDQVRPASQSTCR